MESVDDILAHYGVKGMRWGVRRSSSSGPQKIVVKAKPGKKLKTSGGKGHSATKEARAAAIARQKGKKSTLESLTNQELSSAIKRMQLEKQFSELSSARNTSIIARGQRITKELLGVGNTANDAVRFTSSPAGSKLRDELNKAKTGAK